MTSDDESNLGGTKNNRGPRRARSVGAYLRHTRVMAILVLLAVISSVTTDLTGTTFWERHALLAGLASSVVVVMLSVAVINEVLKRRRRQRWSVPAHYVMFELIRNARMIWIGISDLAGLLATDADQQRSLELGAQIVQDTPALLPRFARSSTTTTLAVACIPRSPSSPSIRTMLGRWVAVMLNAEAYAEVVNRHVELAGDLAWIGALLDARYRPTMHAGRGGRGAEQRSNSHRGRSLRRLAR